MHRKWYRALLRRRFFIIVLILLQAAVFAVSLIISSKISAAIRTALTILSVAAVLHIVSTKDKGSFKLVWVFLILLFPLFGGLLYLLVNAQSSTKRFQKKITETEEKARKLQCHDDYAKAVNALPHAAAQINYLDQFAGFPVYSESSAVYLSSGEMKFEYLLKELEKAEHYIFLEYFIIQEGTMWNTILDILKRKSAEGVLVRIIYDDIGCFLLLPKDYPEQLEKSGIHCAVFNPFRPVLTVVQNNRDHRKIAVIDGKTAFTGGVNLADEYINAYEKHGHWKDTAVMIQGKAAWSFTLMFLQMWELCKGTNEDYAEYDPWKDSTCNTVSDGLIQPYADSPLDEEHVGEHVYLHIINQAKNYLYINTPYLIVDDSMISALTLAAKSGVDVRIITPHIYDKFFVHMTTRSYYRELLKAGVKIYEYTDGFIHSKVFLSDDITATVGTTNLDFRSLYLHFECGVQLHECKTISDIKSDFLATLRICHEIKEEDCKNNVFMHIFQDVLRLFAPLM